MLVLMVTMSRDYKVQSTVRFLMFSDSFVIGKTARRIKHHSPNNFEFLTETSKID